MANVLINEDSMTAIANAIRAKNGSQTTYKPAQMAEAISAISGGGITPTGTKSITANGTYDVTEFASANVNVPTGSTPTGTKEISITANGTTTEDVSAYANAQITVNVPTGGGGGGSSADVLKALIDRTVTNLTLPSGLTKIGARALSECRNLTSLTIPSGVTSIESSALSECRNLTSLTIPSGVTTIGTSAFANCQKLASVELPSTLTGSIQNYTFQYCYALTSLILPSGVSRLETSSFSFCSSLATLVLRKSDGVCALGNDNAFTGTPFKGYNNLTGKVYVPSALIESYKAASNWSTLFNTGYTEFVAIEGSEYE